MWMKNVCSIQLPRALLMSGFVYYERVYILHLHLERLRSHEILLVAVLHGLDVSQGNLMGTLGVEKKPIH